MGSINEKMKIKICADGPYTVYGGIPLTDQILIPDAEGLSIGWNTGKQYPLKEEYDLCRCGHSKDKPFCDGSHGEIFFDGTETASRKPFIEQMEPEMVGPELVLTDVVALCANARFCDRAGGTWDNTRASDNPEAKKIAIQEVFDALLAGWCCTTGMGICSSPNSNRRLAWRSTRSKKYSARSGCGAGSRSNRLTEACTKCATV
jgi:CDGSH-type Zn-finger protein